MWWNNYKSATKLQAYAYANPGKLSWHLAGILAAVWLGLILVLVGLAGFFSARAASHLSDGQIDGLKVNASRSSTLVALASKVSFNQSKSLAAWQSGLNLVAQFETLLNSLEEIKDPFRTSPRYDILPLRTNLSTFKPEFERFLAASRQSWLISLHPQSEAVIKRLESANQLLILLEMILAEPGTYLIVFQNSDELRATGGFIGSLAVVNYDGQYLSEPEILDVYDIAGQLTTVISAPNPVNQYLSGGQGLNLQDANWWPDFRESAEQIANIYQAANFGEVAGVIAITTEVVEELLRITGPIYLPDYQTTATASNFKALARADRDQFFPGSRQKTNFLNHFFVVLQQNLLGQSHERWWRFLHRLDDLSAAKAIQAQHFNPLIADWLTEAKFNGPLSDPNLSDYYLFWVESNVGINKANQAVERSLILTLSDYTSQLDAVISNHNQPGSAPIKTNPNQAGADHLHYVNYQRLLLPSDHQIIEISQDGQLIEDWDEQLIVSDDRQWLEVGFLLVIREGNSSRVNFKFSHPNRVSDDQDRLTLTLVRQAGLPETPWEIRWLNREGQEQGQSLMLDRDKLIILPL